MDVIYLVWGEPYRTPTPTHPQPPPPPPAAHVAPVTINHSGERREMTETAIKHLIIQIIRPINIRTLFQRVFVRLKATFTAKAKTIYLYEIGCKLFP